MESSPPISTTDMKEIDERKTETKSKKRKGIPNERIFATHRSHQPMTPMERITSRA
jgi:hypothetical protein